MRTYAGQPRRSIASNQYGIRTLAIREHFTFDVDREHLAAFDGVRRDLGAVCDQAAADDEFLHDASGLHAEGLCRKLHDHTLDQGIADRSVRRYTLVDYDRAHWFAHLDADGAITERLDGFESDVAHGAVVLVEAACTQSVRDDLCFGDEIVDSAEVDETDPARSVRHHPCVRNPCVHRAPGIEHHVVDTIGDDLTEVFHAFGVDAIDDEDTGRDHVRGAIRQHAGGMDFARRECVELHLSALVAEAADEDARPQYRRTFRADADVAERRVDPGVRIAVEVVDGQRTLVHIDAVLLRLLAVSACVAGRDVKSVHHEAQLVRASAGDDRNLPRHRDVAKDDGTHVGDPGLRVDRADSGCRDYGEVRNTVVRGQPDTIAVDEAEHGTVFVCSHQRKPGRQSDRMRAGHRSCDFDGAGAIAGERRHQFGE